MTGRPCRAVDGDPGLRTRPMVLVDDLDDPVLGADALHHLRRVLRLDDGAEITVADGRGGWRPARLAPRPEPTGPVARTDPPTRPVTVAFAPVKGTRPEWVVQKLTELGVDAIIPVITDRSVVRWDVDRQRKLLDRLATTAAEACQQSRRLHRPTVGRPRALATLLADPDLAGATLCDPAGPPLRSDRTTLVIGPEGGFSPAELAAAPSAALPGEILRAETAAVVAGALLVGLRAGLLRDSG